MHCVTDKNKQLYTFRTLLPADEITYLYFFIMFEYDGHINLKKVFINSHSKIYIISHTLRHLSQIGHGKEMSEKAGPSRTTAECSSCSLSEMLHCRLIFHESMQSIHEMQS